MTQPFLYSRVASTPDSQMAVFKDIDRQVVQIGEDFGTDESIGSMPVTKRFNRCIHWQNDLYFIGRDRIWKYDVEANTGWQSFHIFNTSYAAGHPHPNKLGFTPCSIDGSGVLVTGYGSSVTQMRLIKIDEDGNVTETPPFTPGIAGGFSKTRNSMQRLLRR